MSCGAPEDTNLELLRGENWRERVNTAARSAPRPAAAREVYTLTACFGAHGPAAGLLGARCRIPERALIRMRWLSGGVVERFSSRAQ